MTFRELRNKLNEMIETDLDEEVMIGRWDKEFNCVSDLEEMTVRDGISGGLITSHYLKLA